MYKKVVVILVVVVAVFTVVELWRNTNPMTD